METPVNNETQSQTGQVDAPAPLAQDQGAIQINEVENDKPKENNLTPKMKELAAIQALIPLPESGTPSSQTLQRLSIDAKPFQFSMLSPSSSKGEEVITYGDVSLDEEIIFPKFDLVVITIKKMGILQEALARKKHQDLLRREHR